MTTPSQPGTPDRFAFGKNWRSFIERLDEGRIDEAVHSLQGLLRVRTLTGMDFLDIGSGSGLFSLAAARLGARVVSFDYDAESVACTQHLRDIHGGPGVEWTVHQGSALDAGFMAGLGTFDVVYSWGVLHHTGDMATGIALSTERVRTGGKFALAIYNDQGAQSRFWWRVKRFHCQGPVRRMIVEAIFFPIFFAYGLFGDLRNGRWPGRFVSAYAKQRGMSVVHDWRDWLGGFPFEVATPDAVRSTLARHGFVAIDSRETRGLGCNEFLFVRTGPRISDLDYPGGAPGDGAHNAP